MRRYTPLLLALALPVFAAAPSEPTAPTEAFNKAFAAAAVKGDAAAIADMYSEDGQLLFFKGSPFKGREAIQGFFVGFFKGAQIKAMTITSEDASTFGNAIVDSGNYEMTTVNKAGVASTSTGRYLQVLTKGQDGQWKLFRDCPLPD